MISLIHEGFLYALMGAVMLTVAMLVSMTLQDSIGDLRRFNGTDWPVQLFLILLIWVLLCLPRFRYRPITAPSHISHVLAQIGLGTVGAVFMLFAVMHAATSPFALLFWNEFLAPLVGMVCAGLTMLTALFGLLRAITFASTQDPNDDQEPAPPSTFLAKAHRIARALATLTAIIIGGTVLVSVLILGRPTSVPTTIYTLIFLTIAILLNWPRFTFQSIVAPTYPWHIGPQLGLMFIAIYSVERVTRATLFHSSQFSSFDDIEAFYPVMENILMLPFIIYALLGIARTLPKPEHAGPKVSMAEVFG